MKNLNKTELRLFASEVIASANMGMGSIERTLEYIISCVLGIPPEDISVGVHYLQPSEIGAGITTIKVALNIEGQWATMPTLQEFYGEGNTCAHNNTIERWIDWIELLQEDEEIYEEDCLEEVINKDERWESIKENCQLY